MKLYATTTSERASKGQGGNKYLSIEIKTDKTILTACFIEVIEKDDDNLFIKITGNGELRNGKTYTVPKEYVKISELKGNKKKDDEQFCEICGKKSDNITKDQKCSKCDKIVA